MSSKKGKSISEQYKTARSSLKRAITKVKKEGYTPYIEDIPDLVKKPSMASVQKLIGLRAKVLELSIKAIWSFATNEYVEMTRSQFQHSPERKIIKEAVLSGRKLLSKKEQEEFLKLRGLGSKKIYGEAFADLSGIINTIAESFFILKDPTKYNLDHRIIDDLERPFIEWVSNATEESVAEAKTKGINWEKFAIQFYDSDGVGVMDFLLEASKELDKLLSIKTDIGGKVYASLSPAEQALYGG